ncbi:MAG: class I SAM-dependent methyltransferase [Vallitaleaceae bacterium]|jgi:ubiquinone/menaquinone biosynthesis C-methylase UbiE|nr:class I SAM-dependent methyltransferase [Vallitaleaceae bacterium]
MNFSDRAYNTFMIPLEAIRLRSIRKRLIPVSKGKVLEIGAGTGSNFKYYNPKRVDSLTVMDLNIRDVVRTFSFHTGLDVKFVEGNVTVLPFEDDFFDTVVFTLLFCSVDDPLKGLAEIRRVLKPGGKLLFMEHVLPDKKPFTAIFNKLNPAWMKLSKECHINRETLKTIEEAGFNIKKVETHLKGVVICGIAGI